MNRYLLDTCSFLWMCQDPNELSSISREIIETPENQLLLSPVSTWEIALKLNSKNYNIELNMDLGDFISDAIQKYDLNVIPMNVNHSIGVRNLPFHHKCPFDRLLISISNYENAPLITSDEEIKKYDVRIIW